MVFLSPLYIHARGRYLCPGSSLVLTIENGGSRDAATYSFAKVKGNPEILGIGQARHSSASSCHGVIAINGNKMCYHVVANVKAKHLDAIASMLPRYQQRPPPRLFHCGPESCHRSLKLRLVGSLPCIHDRELLGHTSSDSRRGWSNVMRGSTSIAKGGAAGGCH